METFEDTTIKEARTFLDTIARKGGKCPCCTQFVKIYKYPMFGTSVRALIELYKLDKAGKPAEYYHVRQYAEQGKGNLRAPHFAELRFWGLIEPAPNEDPVKKASGYWRITQKGRDFVDENITVPSHIEIYNNRFVGFAPNAHEIGVQDALGNKFDYRELMA